MNPTLIFAIAAALPGIGSAADIPIRQSVPATTPAARPPATGSIASVADGQARIDAVVRYLGGRGIRLTEQPDGWWATQPGSNGEGFALRVKFRLYPLTAGENEMRRELSRVNLAFVLNGPARLAMSYPGALGPLPAGTLLEDLAGWRELMQAFQSYRVGGNVR